MAHPILDMSTAPQRFIASLSKHVGAEEFAALEACLNCRQCGSACAWYLATGDEKLHPKYKKDFIRDVYARHIQPAGRIAQRLGLAQPLTVDELREHMSSFWQCTTCGRCSLACPLSLNNRAVVRAGRAAFSDSGIIEDNSVLNTVYVGSRDYRHSFALTRNQVFARLGLFLLTEGIDAPFDVVGADCLFVCTAAGNTRFPDFGVAVPKLLNAAKVRYTLSSRLTDTGTDIEHVLVSRELSRAMLLEVEHEAQRLQVSKVVISECGCDVRTFYVEAGDILGRPFALPVESIDSVLLNCIQSGDLPVDRVTESVTFHDPCKVTRLTGLGELERQLLARVAENVVEMEPHGERNYCCNGGTGPLRLPELAPLRRLASKFKAEQIRATHAKRVVTPCAVCMLSLTDICSHYELGPKGQRMAYLTFEVVAEASLAALTRLGQAARLRSPAVFEDMSASEVRSHGVIGLMDVITRNSDYPAVYQWLIKDEIVNRFCAAHSQTSEHLNAMRPVEESAALGARQ